MCRAVVSGIMCAARCFRAKTSILLCDDLWWLFHRGIT
ncbi:hypothetical protein yaldo0001_20120 [Yersinia aldovae ATCC 35236]|nr:hypothetical protein yaldo0001_20120 [Yersinia aldovae ATCC 35236]